MDLVSSVSEQLGPESLPAIYQERIRTQRTRSVDIEVPQKENHPEILYTLLGIELKVGRRRLACPDLATARYMRVFARLGCRAFAVPYDISKISAAADELETAWHRSLLLLGELSRDRSARSQASLRSRLISAIRTEIASIGPGEAMPAFDRETRQRPTKRP